jgi:protoheme IX farnesyltransferase
VASPWLRLLSLWAAAAVLLAVVSGAADLGTTHDVLAALALPPLTALVIGTWLRHRPLLPYAVTALVLFGAAALVTAPSIHLALAAAALAAALVLAVLVHREHPHHGVRWGNLPVSPDPFHRSASRTGGFAASLRDYVSLTKPRIMSLLLVTGFCGLVAGAGGLPPWELTMAAMVGLALACGGASALNHVIDRDIDKLMGARTRRRPVAADRLSAEHALEFGLVLSALSFTLLAGAVNVLTATLALVGNLFYVLVYTGWLKRSTPQNIVIGGAAGAVPPLVGWAAATGSLALPALALFLIVFLWTPPHFWALALLIKRDYAAAGIPMLPVVRGDKETARQIVLYSVVLVAFTVVPFAAGWFGALYLASALVLGAAFLWLAVRLRLSIQPARASALFHYSLLYLALIFVAAAIDPVIA